MCPQAKPYQHEGWNGRGKNPWCSYGNPEGFKLSCRCRNGQDVAWNLSREMIVKWKMEEKPANIPNILKTLANHSANKRYSRMTYNAVAHRAKRSAKAKLINKNRGRLRNFVLRSVEIVRDFPTMIRKAITLKQVVQKGFHSFKSIFRPNT